VEFGVEADAPDATALASPDVPPYRRLVGPNQWPDPATAPGFKPAVVDFLNSMEELSMRIMELLAISLDLSGDYFQPSFGEDPNVQMKMARYPPAPASSEDRDSGDASSNAGEGVGCFGVGAHTDSGYLSILLQDDVGGLQVQNGDGDWIDAPPLPGCMVVNLGEMLQLCTRGYYLATPHRVVSRPCSTRRDRISVPYFWNPGFIP
jgi:isopenicillin N synthase-like dioxygenase